MTQTIPIAIGIRLFLILQIRLLAISNIEEVGQETYLVTLNAVTHQSGCRNV